jgi:serine/threonine protein kinase
MDQTDGGAEDSLPLEAQRRIDAVCERFEKAWQMGQEPRPRIEDFLGGFDGAEREALLRELLRVELACRLARGDRPVPRDYESRFPGFGALVRQEIDKRRPGAVLAVAPAAPGVPRDVPAVRPRSPNDLSTMSDIFLGSISDSDIFLDSILSTMSDIFLGSISDHVKRFDIPHGQTTVGRRADANIVLSCPSISRLHALFERDGRMVWLTDLNSLNGTYVNGCRMESNRRVMLYPGDRIHFGSLLEPDLTFVILRNRVAKSMLEGDVLTGPSTSDISPAVPLPQALSGPPAEQDQMKCHPSMDTDWHPGDLIENRWEVQQVLHGGMGIVYVVLDRETGERLAAKTYRDDLLTTNPDLARRFEREALAWINLDSHPNIVKAKYVRTLHDKPFLFLEFIEGGSLQGILPSLCIRKFPDGPFYAEDHIFGQSLKIQHLALSFCDGMMHASQFGIRAHRDIKAANCLVSKDGRRSWTLKITDFGLARIFDDMVQTTELPYIVNQATEGVRTADSPSAKTVYEAHVPDWLSIFATRTGTVAGTPTHMAPEQFNDIRHVDVRADIYSFGVLLFQMITGRLPFTATTWLGYKHLHQNVVLPPANLGYFTGIVERCLAKNPDARPASFLEVRNALMHTVWTPQISYYDSSYGPQVPGIELTEAELIQKGLSLAELGCYGQALAVFNHIINRNPLCGKAWREKGNFLMKLIRDFPQALESLEHAKQLGELGLEEQMAFCRDQLL